MISRRFTLRHLILPTVLVGLVALVNIAITNAQGSAPQVTNVSTSAQDTTATITFSTNGLAGAKILYGQTTAYGTSSPALGYTTPERTSHVIALNNLTPSTTYHFQIEVNNSSGTSRSADRSFTTRSGSVSSGELVLNNIVADCVDTRCQILFTPNRAANVRIVWDATAHADFGGYPAANIVGDAAGVFSAARRALAIPSTGAFAAGTIYYYRLQAFEQGDPQPVLTTNDLNFRTSTNANDHTFSTGGCQLPDGSTIAIGQCGAGGYYCPSGGGPPVQDCTKSCGYICPANSTCRDSGVCEADPALNGSPFQCNKTTTGPTGCYDDSGAVRTPAPAGCYATWGQCNANTILKVRPDRGCNLWLTCATSVQTEPNVGAPAENLCLTLTACNSLNQQGQCNKYLPPGQCNNDPLRFCATDSDCLAGGSCNLPTGDAPTQSLRDLTYTTPEQIKQIANLSGNVTAGLDWNQIGGATVLQGNLPWQMMRQVGGDSQIINGDFERNPPNVTPWEVVPSTADSKLIKVEFEEQNNSANHVLHITLITEMDKTSGTCSNPAGQQCTTDTGATGCTSGVCQIGVCSNNAAKACSVDDTCTPPGTCNRLGPVPFAGVASDLFSADVNELYYAEVRLKSANGSSPKIRVQFGYKDYTCFNIPCVPTGAPTFVDVVATGAWQRVTLGPIKGMFDQARLGIVCADPATCVGAEIFVDDIQVKPILQINTNPSYITPSCRLYPKSDSPACDYFDQNGILYKGWKGYCMENDSVTGTCLSWWPVDVLRGETSLFGTDTTTGYTDRAPLYLCAEARGNNKGNDFSGTQAGAYVIGEALNYGGKGDACDDSGGCKEVTSSPYTIGACHSGLGLSTDRTQGLLCRRNAETKTKNLIEEEVSKVWFHYVGVNARQNDDITFFNTPDWMTGVETKGTAGSDDRITFKAFRAVDQANNEIVWHYESDCSTADTQLNANCNSVRLIFDATTRIFKAYEIQVNDRTASETEQVPYQVIFYSKESCQALVEVVQPNGGNEAFASRVNSSAYTVPDLKYEQGSDLGPFGGALGPANGGTTPLNWPLVLPVETPISTIDPPGQSRGGQPYACNGPCDAYVCNLQPTLSCLDTNGKIDLTKVAACEDIEDPTTGEKLGGVCTGTTMTTGSNVGAQSFDPAHVSTAVDPVTDKAYFAQERIRRVFARAYSLWSWSGGAYRESPDIPWVGPTSICPIPAGENAPKRPAYPSDFCAVPPQIISDSAKFLTDGGTTATISGGSGSVGIKFNTMADADQVPLQGFSINWGDTKNSYAYPYAPRDDSVNPHIFSHVYNNTGPNCSAAGQTNCCTVSGGRKTCNYEIQIQVKDNWGWCNNAVAGTKCPEDTSTWYNTGLKVRVRP